MVYPSCSAGVGDGMCLLLVWRRGDLCGDLLYPGTGTSMVYYFCPRLMLVGVLMSVLSSVVYLSCSAGAGDGME